MTAQVSERLLQVHEVQRDYLLSLGERLGVHLSAVDSDYDERNVTTILTLTWKTKKWLTDEKKTLIQSVVGIA
jgi:hypothetical protein